MPLPGPLTNLSEMHCPLMDFIVNLSRTGDTTAKTYYGVDKGWCLGQNSDIWAMTNPIGLNVGSPSWTCWTMRGACNNLSSIFLVFIKFN